MRLALVLFVAATSGCATNPQLTFQLTSTGEVCSIDVGGQQLAPEAAANAAAFQHPERGKVLILASKATPYRCIGAAMYYFQRSGFTRINFKAQ
jgi:hypothetical protein